LPYVVKWKLTEGGDTFQSPDAFAVPSAAIDFACAELRPLPEIVWIEGPNGVQIERSVIWRGCQDRRPPNRLVKRGKLRL